MRQLLFALRRLLYALFFLIPLSISAQIDFGTAHSVNFKIDNDVLFGTDDYYSNGIEVGYQAPKFFSLFNKQKPTQQSFKIRHKIFTPSKFNQDRIDFDRPFVSSLSLAFNSMFVMDEKQLIIAQELEAGIQGRNSGGRTVQNLIHRILPASQEVEDWQYQLETDILINYKTALEKGISSGDFWMINAIGSLEAGTPTLSTDLGLHMRVGKMFNRFEYVDFTHQNSVFFFYTKPMVRLTAYNTYLQGGPFTQDHPYALREINYFNYSIESGVYFSTGRIAVDLGFTYQSPLAESLNRHRWASLNLTYAIN